VVVETPFVSGNLSTGNPTGRGYFTVAYLSSDLYLSGPTWNDHVDYWIPFDLVREIGLHDSSWRDAYGGDIYINDGSHGCINTPLAAMRKIYENIWEGVPVIVY
jgi:lipoprotein-anchoring transpeptidase ErfK/SrfK